MDINKETMHDGAMKFLKTLFALPEIEKVAIKDVVIHSIDDQENIERGLKQCYHDQLSDVDINVWIKLNPKDFNGETPIYKKYFPRLGIENEIFGIAFQERMDSVTNKEGMRICMKSGFRMDFTCFTRCSEDAATLPEQDLRTNSKVRTPEWSLDQADRFWFVTIQALAKLLRHDYLISDHLSYMLLMDGLVLQMQDRDRMYNTNFHRYGYSEQLAYRNVDLLPYEKYLTKDDDTYNHIVKNLCKAVLSYDDLMEKENSNYCKRSGIFFEIWDSYLEALAL